MAYITLALVFAAVWPYWVFFVVSLITILLFFFIREKRIRRAAKEALHRQQAMINLELNAFQAQLDPHFIFNSLNAIHHYILATSTDMASLYLTRFSKLMRLMMGNFKKEWITLQEDLDALELYLQLEQLRFEQQFTYRLVLEPEVEPMHTLIPPLIIQPYVQYAIWHRLLVRPQKSGGQLDIIIGLKGERLYIKVEDNGNPTASLLDDTAARLANGIDIASERLYLMSERYHMKASISAQPILDSASHPCGNRLVISMEHNPARQELTG
ncbi:histidine kinase [Chitinophaga sp. sic0106]|uniref:sensor histidine kinase n=1 Tax=Chitinophaga sp. sic0106 TaxID=2854785 RepID=UPI001C44E7D0|nr:histidine kinase [Chitinophaga sp. sic0106]